MGVHSYTEFVPHHIWVPKSTRLRSDPLSIKDFDAWLQRELSAGQLGEKQGPEMRGCKRRGFRQVYISNTKISGTYPNSWAPFLTATGGPTVEMYAEMPVDKAQMDLKTRRSRRFWITKSEVCKKLFVSAAACHQVPKPLPAACRGRV